MQLTKREKKIKYSVYGAIIIALALLQNVSGLVPSLAGAKCFLLIPGAVLLSVGEDEKTAIVIGLSAGILWDCVATGSYGFNALFLMVACYVLSVLVTHLLRATFWLGVTANTLSSFLYALVYWLVFVVSKGGDGCLVTIWRFYLPSFFYTAIIGFFMNFLFVPLKKKLNKE